MTTMDATLALVRAKRREVDWARLALTLAFVLPWALGWVVRKAFVVLGVAASFVWAAGVVGWEAAKPAASEDSG